MTIWSKIDSHTLRDQNDGFSSWSENSALSQRQAGKHFKRPEGRCVIILVTGSDINTLISSFSLWRSSWSSGRGFLLCAFRTCSLLCSSLIFFSHWSQVYLKTALKPVSPWLSRLNYRTDPLAHLMHTLCLLGGFGEATQNRFLSCADWPEGRRGTKSLGRIGLEVSPLIYYITFGYVHVKEATVRIEFNTYIFSVHPNSRAGQSTLPFPLVYLFWVTSLASSDAWLWPTFHLAAPLSACCLLPERLWGLQRV